MGFVEVGEAEWGPCLRGVLFFVAVEMDKDPGCVATLSRECAVCSHLDTSVIDTLAELSNALFPCVGSWRCRASFFLTGESGDGSLVLRTDLRKVFVSTLLKFPSGVSILDTGSALVRVGVDPVPASEFRGFSCPVCADTGVTSARGDPNTGSAVG
jgi:hypothetical protein